MTWLLNNSLIWFLDNSKLLEPRVMQPLFFDAAIYKLPFVLGISSLSPSVFEISASEVLPDSHLSKAIDDVIRPDHFIF